MRPEIGEVVDRHAEGWRVLVRHERPGGDATYVWEQVSLEQAVRYTAEDPNWRQAPGPGLLARLRRLVRR